MANSVKEKTTENKMEDNKDNSTFSSKLKKCDRCDYASKWSAHVNKHKLAVHDKVYKFACDQCELRTMERNKIELHKLAVHGDVFNFPCNQCDLKFKIKRHLTVHIKVVHERHRLQKCKKCNFVSPHVAQVRIHVMAVHDQLKHYCDVVGCDYKTAYKCSLQTHFQKIHLKLDLKKYKCDHCSYAVGSKRRLQDHVDFMHDKKFKYVCGICREPYENDPKLDDHKMTVHEGITKKFGCDVVDCDYRANSNHIMTSHFRRAHLKLTKEKKYRCDTCDYTTDSKKVLQDHVDFRHEKNFKYVCDVCNVPYPSQRKLKEHGDAVHKKLRRYKCKECPYGTNQKTCWDDHIKVVHRKIVDDLKCLLCPYVTGYRYASRAHEHTHVMRSKEMVPEKEKKNALEKFEINKEDSKKFNCKRCKFSTTVKSRLQDHIDFKHENNFKYICDTCNAPFPFQQNLTIHKMGVHEKLRRHKCEECPYGNNITINLEDHVKVVHRKIMDDLKCILCPYVTGYRYLIKAHKQTHVRHSKGILPKNKKSVLEEFEIKEEEEVTFLIGDLKQKDAGLILEKGPKKKKKTALEKFEKKKKKKDLKKFKCEMCKFSTRISSFLEDHVEFEHEKKWIHLGRHKKESKDDTNEDNTTLEAASREEEETMVVEEEEEEVTFVIKVKEEENEIEESEPRVFASESSHLEF